MLLNEKDALGPAKKECDSNIKTERQRLKFKQQDSFVVVGWCLDEGIERIRATCPPAGVEEGPGG